MIHDTPGGLPALDRDTTARLRDASARLDDSTGTRDGFARHVLSDLLDWHSNLAVPGNVPPTLTTAVVEHATHVRPDFALPPAATDTAPAQQPLLLGLVIDPRISPTARTRAGSGTWTASPADRLAHALRAQRVPLGLVTDATIWTLVAAPTGGATTIENESNHRKEDRRFSAGARRWPSLSLLCEKMRAMRAMEGPPTDQGLDASGAPLLPKVSTKTVLKLARTGELPARKVGRGWRFETSALLDHVARRVSA